MDVDTSAACSACHPSWQTVIHWPPLPLRWHAPAAWSHSEGQTQGSPGNGLRTFWVGNLEPRVFREWSAGIGEGRSQILSRHVLLVWDATLWPWGVVSLKWWVTFCSYTLECWWITLEWWTTLWNYSLELHTGVVDFKGKHNCDANVPPAPPKMQLAGLWKTLRAAPQCLRISGIPG